jgi:glycosyltransferase involved in cell wall biosynthesis
VKVAWFSPLNPQPSGIADYCEELLPALSRHLDIDIYIDPAWMPSNPAIRERFSIRPYSAAAFRAGEYDQIVYHMGNDYSSHRFIHEALLRHPGVVVLHDLVLMGFYAARENAGRRFSAFVGFLQRFYPERADWIAEQCGGRHPFPIWEGELARQLPMNEEVCRSATALITHSRFVLERLGLPAGKPGTAIPHHGHAVRPVDRPALRRSLGISERELLLISTGYVTRNKRYDLVLDVLGELGRGDLRYLIVGGDPGGLLERLLAGGRNDVLTRGFAPLADMERWIAGADIGVNLRNPTMGESSGSLMRMLSYGRPALISDAGAYAEIPDHCAIKIADTIDEREMLKAAITALADDADLRFSLGREAAAYAVDTCGIERCALLYADFLGRLPGRAKEAS